MMGLLDRIGSMTPDQKKSMALSLASGFAGMSGNPNAPQIMKSIALQQEALKEQRQQQTALTKLAKQTAMAQQLLGDKFPMLSGALSSGIISPQDAIKAAREGGDVKVVGKALVDSKGNVIYRDEDAGTDKTTAFNTLDQRAKAAGLKEGTDAYQQFMIQGGAKQGMSIVVKPDGTVELKEGVSATPKKSEGQSSAAGFYLRMTESNPTIGMFEQEGTKFGQALLSGIPFNMGNWLQSTEFQQYDQAKRDFINAQLRKESGAAIGKDEFANAEVQYFPVIGDSPEVIAQKRRNREIVIEAMRLAAGISGEKQTQDQQKVLTYNPETGELE